MKSPEIPIVFEDRDILVIDKPAGVLTSSGPREKRPTALAGVREYVAANDPRARVGLVHRLDREASGLLVFSKNASAFQTLKQQFFDHSASRVYLAVVSPAPREKKGQFESSLVEWADGSVHSTRLAGRGQQAVTQYCVVSEHQANAVVRVTLQTGRKHQIRAHLAEAGCPIVGDGLYGGVSNPAGLMLVAIELALNHPRTGRRQTFRIDVPDRMTPLM